MNESHNDIELIEAYILGSLSQEEERSVNQRLAADAAFKAEYDSYAKLIGGLKTATAKKTLEEIKQFEKKSGRSVPFYRQTFFRVAAAVTALASSILLILYLQKEPVNSYYASYYKELPNQIVPLTRDSAVPESLKERAYYAYEIKQYEKAIELLIQIPSQEDEGAHLLYTGVSYLALQDSKNAIVYLNEYLDISSDFKDEASWYLALAHAMENQPSKALEIINRIQNLNQQQLKFKNELTK